METSAHGTSHNFLITDQTANIDPIWEGISVAAGTWCRLTEQEGDFMRRHDPAIRNATLNEHVLGYVFLYSSRGRGGF